MKWGGVIVSTDWTFLGRKVQSHVGWTFLPKKVEIAAYDWTFLSKKVNRTRLSNLLFRERSSLV